MSEAEVEETRWRYGLPGYFSGADLPQSGAIKELAYGVGWPELDAIFKFYPGQFVVVTGKPGSGKSTFVLNCLCQLAKTRGVVSFCHVPENERHIIGKLRPIWNDDASFDYFLEKQIFFQSARPEHYGSEVRELSWVLDRACDSMERDHAEIVLLDPWNQIEKAKPRDQLLTDYIGECLRYLTAFAQSMNAIVIMVAHPTKPADRGGVGLYDIEGSAHWYNRCDSGLVISRDPERPRAEVAVQKVREEPDAGQLGSCYFQVARSGIFTPEYGSTSLVGGEMADYGGGNARG